MFKEPEQKIVKLTEGYTDTDLFQSGGRKWLHQHLQIGRYGNGFTRILSHHLSHLEVKLENGRS